MNKLYRAISQNEKDDFSITRKFRTGRNTLEAKQFFKSRKATEKFVESAVLQEYDPPYLYLLTISIDEILFETSNPIMMKLDGYEAVNIEENDLIYFNNCIIFVEEEEL